MDSAAAYEVELLEAPKVQSCPGLGHTLRVTAREARLMLHRPWVRSLGKLAMEVTTDGWRFPRPLDGPSSPATELCAYVPRVSPPSVPAKRTRLQPSNETVMLKDRLLYLLQPPLEDLFAGKRVLLPLQPFPYQLQGITFLMPRHAALLADEMGLGKTAQVLLAIRLLFSAGLIRSALVVCPKPLVINWTHELRLWAADLPFEVIGGDTNDRRAGWFVSNCPLKLVNYELLTRDAEHATDKRIHFDLVVLDEAQRIKSRETKTAQVVRRIHRTRSWAMTGTPIENRTEDLVSIYAFLDADRVPAETPAKRLAQLTSDSILRRTKEDVACDVPPKSTRDTFLDLTPAQRIAYDRAETEGIVHLNGLGDTVTVQHVFELVMRLKQICNFDPLTGDSAKLDQLRVDVAEVAASGRKAIVFSQWVEPLARLARELAEFGPLLFHGRIPQRNRQATLDQFKKNRKNHIILMSYGTGGVGLNLQCANYVFLFDRWWNPAVEDQAINRAHRIGQKEPVFVTRFVTPGTIEQRIAEILERKRQLFNDVIEQNGPPPSFGLTEEEIFSLFDVRARPKRMAA